MMAPSSAHVYFFFLVHGTSETRSEKKGGGRRTKERRRAVLRGEEGEYVFARVVREKEEEEREREGWRNNNDASISVCAVGGTRARIGECVRTKREGVREYLSLSLSCTS